MCWRGVVSGCGSWRYKYRFRAVLESWISNRGVLGGRISRARIVSIISAVFMLVLAVPMYGGRYVVRDSSGLSGCVYQVEFCVMGAGASGRIPSVALAVMMGKGWSGCVGVRPPSTVSMIGEVENDSCCQISRRRRWLHV